ncbi:MAG: cation diffusion facilitator family transporter [Propionibacteriaceae bacterium]|nr:cation diffusion facilitator family transporter [Propionibacteriaceae bacterium]
MPNSVNLTKYAWLSIAAALVTIGLKTVAWRMTGSVGLFSDAAESVVNLAAGILALVVLTIAARPPDDDHHFGHHKAEYFSAAVEGVLIILAAVIIVSSAVERIFHPHTIESLSWGILLSSVAAGINAIVAMILIRAGKKYRSLTLVADGRHLWTDVVTTLGVVVAIVVVLSTGIQILDPVVALLVAVNISVTGVRLIRASIRGLMDVTLPEEENQLIAQELANFSSEDVLIHGLRTRLSGRQRFAIMDILVPGDWTVAKSHDLVEDIEQTLQALYPGILVQSHLEPKEDPRAYCDYDVEIPIPTITVNKPQSSPSPKISQ